MIGSAEVEAQIVPAVLALAADKTWRVKLAIIDFIPLLAEILGKDIFKNKLESAVLGWLSDPVY